MSLLEWGWMSLLGRHRWFAAAAGITLAFAIVSFAVRSSHALTATADLLELALLLCATGVAAANALARSGMGSSFWKLMTLGFLLWTTNQAAVSIWEIVLRQPLPDPFIFDVILFFHVVPMCAAVAWRPDLTDKEGHAFLGLLNFLMLLGWWLFLYAFIIFPYQYVALNVVAYNIRFDLLYGVENAFLLVILSVAAWTSLAGWRRLYLHFLGAFSLYSLGSHFLNWALTQKAYYTGSLYDIPLIASVAWIIAVSLSVHEWDLESVQFSLERQSKALIPRLAMLAILSLPALGLWAILFDKSAAPLRAFRLFAVLVAMCVLGGFVFLRQYLQDQVLIALLRESRRAYDSQKQLQNQLVQKEKLASLGNLVAGAAHEINHPIDAIMSHSEQLWSQERLTEEQNALVRKIVNQARRTSDLVNNLLSFAQQTTGEKVLVDLGVLLTRATQMFESRRASGNIQVRLSVDCDSPHICASANQLFQAFVEIIENALDALDDAGGGSLEISAQRQGQEIVLQFSDNGPGIRDPQRVFDPFYTTKPVGKGTGLGLSAVYGVIQDHGGQITCRNKPDRGAVFIVRLPATAEPASKVAGAAR